MFHFLFTHVSGLFGGGKTKTRSRRRATLGETREILSRDLASGEEGRHAVDGEWDEEKKRNTVSYSKRITLLLSKRQG